MKNLLTMMFADLALTVDEAKAAGGADDSAFELITRVEAAMGRTTKAVQLIRAIEQRHEHVCGSRTFIGASTCCSPRPPLPHRRGSGQSIFRRRCVWAPGPRFAPEPSGWCCG